MTLRKRTDSYWLKRANQRLTRSERISKAHMRELAKVYNEARRQTVESLKQIYAAYYKGQDGFDMQALRSIVPSGELKRFLDDMKRLGISTDLPDNYNARITRLRFINEQLAAQAHKVAMSERTIDSKALREVYTDSYYRAGYDVARGIGSTPSGFSTLDQRTVDKVMNARFEGRNFSTRVWKNSDILANKLKGELATAIATGQSIQKTAANFRNDFNVNQYYAERLIRTETNHFHNSAELEAYKEMGFEKFKFLATLDNRTSEICQEMDGKIFDVKNGLPGENIPPLHPNCRSTIVPYFKGYEPETRLYRDPETGKNKYTYNLNYQEWRQTLPKPESTEVKPKTSSKTAKISKKITENGQNGDKVAHLNASEHYEGKIINNREDIRKLVDKLYNSDSAIADGFFRLASMEDKRVTLTALTPEEARQYSRFGLTNQRAKLQMGSNAFRHLLNSGHIGGKKKNGGIDENPLTLTDIKNVRDVFKHPDRVYSKKGNIVAEKLMKNNHRLVLEIGMNGKAMYLKSYFNINKKPLK